MSQTLKASPCTVTVRGSCWYFPQHHTDKETAWAERVQLLRMTLTSLSNRHLIFPPATTIPTATRPLWSDRRSIKTSLRNLTSYRRFKRPVSLHGNSLHPTTTCTRTISLSFLIIMHNICVCLLWVIRLKWVITQHISLPAQVSLLSTMLFLPLYKFLYFLICSVFCPLLKNVSEGSLD